MGDVDAAALGGGGGGDEAMGAADSAAEAAGVADGNHPFSLPVGVSGGF
jgi:hypothetical protein